MDKYHTTIGALFIIGAILLGYSALRGEISVGVAVFIPFIVGSGVFASTGFLVLFLAIALFSLGFLKDGAITQGDLSEKHQLDTQSERYERPTIKTGGIILIGPLPIVFGSTKKMVVSLLCIAVILIIILLILTL